MERQQVPEMVLESVQADAGIDEATGQGGTFSRRAIDQNPRKGHYCRGKCRQQQEATSVDIGFGRLLLGRTSQIGTQL